MTLSLSSCFLGIYAPMFNAINDLPSRFNLINYKCLESQNHCLTTAKKIFEKAKAVFITIAKIVYHFLEASVCFYVRYKSLAKFENEGSLSDLNLVAGEIKEKIKSQIISDLKILNITPKEPLVNKLISSFARSFAIYGPVLRIWVDKLLTKAEDQKAGLIFLARDGIVAYELACELIKRPEYQERFPSLNESGKISLVYFSRKVVGWSKDHPDLFKSYIKQQIPEYESSNLIMVDVGFMGSMIDTIRSHLKDNDGKRVSFEYLISHTPKASGYFSYKENLPLFLRSATRNLAIYWIEDAHQGIEASPKYLVNVGGKIYPNTKIPNKEVLFSSDHIQNLLRLYSKQGALEGASRYDASDKESADKRFLKTLEKIRNCELPRYIDH